METQYDINLPEQRSNATAKKAGLSKLSPSQLFEWMNNGEIFLVDLRSPEEFEQSRIAGSFLLPLSRLDITAFPKVPGLRTVFICHQGSTALKAADDLAGVGIDTVFVLEGGLDAWLSAGYDVDE